MRSLPGEGKLEGMPAMAKYHQAAPAPITLIKADHGFIKNTKECQKQEWDDGTREEDRNSEDY